KAQLPTTTISDHHRATQHVGPPEEPLRLGQLSLGDRLPNAGARERASLIPLQGLGASLEAVASPQPLEGRHIPRAPLPETKIVPHEHEARAQVADQELLDELFRLQGGERLVEALHDDA